MHVINDLKAEGTSVTLKRSTLIKNIHLIEDEGEIECKAKSQSLSAKKLLLKKA